MWQGIRNDRLQCYGYNWVCESTVNGVHINIKKINLFICWYSHLNYSTIYKPDVMAIYWGHCQSWQQVIHVDIVTVSCPITLN